MEHFKVLLLLCICAGIQAQYCEQGDLNFSFGSTLSSLWSNLVFTDDITRFAQNSEQISEVKMMYDYLKDDLHIGVHCTRGTCGDAAGNFCDDTNPYFTFVIMNDTAVETPLAMVSILPQNCPNLYSSDFNIPPQCQSSDSECDLTTYFGVANIYYETISNSTPSKNWGATTKGYFVSSNVDIEFTINNFSAIAFSQKPNLIKTQFQFAYALINGVNNNNPDIMISKAFLPSWKKPNVCTSENDATFMYMYQWTLPNYTEASFKQAIVDFAKEIVCPEQIVILSTRAYSNGSTYVEFFVAVANDYSVYLGGLMQSLGAQGTYYASACGTYSMNMYRDMLQIYNSGVDCFSPFSQADFPPNTQCNIVSDDGTYTQFTNSEHQWTTCVYDVDLSQICRFTDKTGLFTNWSVQTYINYDFYTEPVLLYPTRIPNWQYQLVIDASATYSDLPILSYNWKIDSCSGWNYYDDPTLCDYFDGLIGSKNWGPVLTLTWTSDYDTPSFDTIMQICLTVSTIEGDYYAVTGDMSIVHDNSIVAVYPLVPTTLGVSPAGARLLVSPSLSPALANNTVINYWDLYINSGGRNPYDISSQLIINGPEAVINPMITPLEGFDSIATSTGFELIHSAEVPMPARRPYENSTVYDVAISPVLISYYLLGNSLYLYGNLLDPKSIVNMRTDLAYPPLNTPITTQGQCSVLDYYPPFTYCDTQLCYPMRDECIQPSMSIYPSSQEVPIIQFKVLTLPPYGKMLPSQGLSIQAIVSTAQEFIDASTTTKLTGITFSWTSDYFNLSLATDSVNGAVLTLKPGYTKYKTTGTNYLEFSVQVGATLNGAFMNTTSTIDLTDFYPTDAPSLGRITAVRQDDGTYTLSMVEWRDNDVQYILSENENNRPRFLRYQFKYFITNQNGQPSAEVNLGPLQYKSVMTTNLPAGNITVVGYVYDCWGASNRATFGPMIVDTAPVSTALLVGLQGDVETQIANGNPDGAVASLTQLLMYINSDPNFSDAEYRKYALDTIKRIGNITYSKEMYSQLLALFPHITTATDKLNPELILVTFDTMSELLDHPVSQGGIDEDQADPLLACFSDALEFKKTKVIPQEDQKNISSSIWNTENEVVGKLLLQLECGSPSAVIQAPNINLFVQKGPADGTFPGTQLSDGLVQSNFIFPQGAIDNPCVGGHYVSYVNTIFDFTQEKNIVGEVIGLDFYDSNGSKVNTDNLDQNVLINIVVKDFDLSNFQPDCRFWNEKTKDWDDKGCKKKDVLQVTSNEVLLVCECSHLTNFTSWKAKNSNNDLEKIIIIIAVCGGAAVILLAAILGLLVARKGKKKEETTLPADPAPAKPALVIIPPEEIVIEEKIGGGAFGEVYKGTYLGTTAVALKKLTSETNSEEFEEEAALLQNLRHTNIVYFLGIYTSEAREKYMVTEFMPRGSVLGMLKKSGHKLSLEELINLCKDAAAGMSYLEMCKIVHRDLAARNLLISGSSKNYTVKVADFGMSRKAEGMTAQNAPEKFPVKWTAPEAIETKAYSSKADVWSFGVTIWEIFELGASPYTNMTNKEAAQFVLAGKRLTKPEKCPDEVYKLMLKCWASKPEERPTFKQIYSELKKFADSLKDSSTSSDDSEKTQPVRKVTGHKQDYHNNDNYSSPNNSDAYEQPPAKSSSDSPSSSGVYHTESDLKESRTKTHRYSDALGRDAIEMGEVKQKKKNVHEYEYDQS